MPELDRQGGNFSSSDARGAVDLFGPDNKPVLSTSSDERFAERFGMQPAEEEAPAAPAAADTAPRAAPQPAAPIAPSPLPPPPVPPTGREYADLSPAAVART
jgi:hypothetical protein